MRPKGCPETSVINYHYSLRDNREEWSSHLRALLGYYGASSGNFVTESPIFRFEPEDETMSRNVGNKLPLLPA